MLGRRNCTDLSAIPIVGPPARTALMIELSHVGEALVSEMLSRVSERGQLDRVACAATGSSLTSDLDGTSPRFVADQAVLRVRSAERTYSCDGAQTVDVLCVGEQHAVAIEVKLGEARMSLTEFPRRFCGRCTISRHADPRLAGNMIAILDGLLPFADGRVFATLGDRSWPLRAHWWLVVRERIWRSWADRLPVHRARILLFDELARLYGGPREFDDLVQHVVGNNFAGRWNIEFNPQRPVG